MSTNTGGFTAPPSSPPRPLAPAGPHIARLYGIVDMGTHTENIPGKPPQSLRKIRLFWEMPNAKQVFDEKKGEEPFVINKEFTFSMGERANLRKFIEAWRGRKFDSWQEANDFNFEKILGKDCQITIVHSKAKGSGKEYADIASISKLMQGMVCPPAINKSVLYRIEMGQGGTFVNLPEWVRKEILTCNEFTKKPAEPQQPTQAAGQPAATSKDDF